MVSTAPLGPLTALVALPPPLRLQLQVLQTAQSNAFAQLNLQGVIGFQTLRQRPIFS